MRGLSDGRVHDTTGCDQHKTVFRRRRNQVTRCRIFRQRREVGSAHLHSRSWTVADHICRDFEVENDSFRSELRGRPSERNRRMQHGRRRRTYALGRWHALRVAVATIVFAGGVLLSACAGASDVSGVDPSSATGSTETTRAPGTATAPTTAASSDPASLVIDRLFEAFNAQDARAVAGVFGDDVVYVHSRIRRGRERCRCRSLLAGVLR
jgi:hypothetical protein